MRFAFIFVCLLLVSCGKRSLDGWWVVESVTRNVNQHTVSIRTSYLIGFNNTFQMYALDGSQNCDGIPHNYRISRDAITVNAVGECTAKAATYEMKNGKLILHNGKFNEEFSFIESVLNPISETEAARHVQALMALKKKNLSRKTPVLPKSKSAPQGTSFTMEQLNGFWRLSRIQYKRTNYCLGETIIDGNRKIRIANDLIINYFHNGEWMQFAETFSPFAIPRQIRIEHGKIVEVVPGKKTPGEAVVLSIDNLTLWTGPFATAEHSQYHFKEQYTRLTQNEAALKLIRNPVFKKMFP